MSKEDYKAIDKCAAFAGEIISHALAQGLTTGQLIHTCLTLTAYSARQNKGFAAEDLHDWLDKCLALDQQFTEMVDKHKG